MTFDVSSDVKKIIKISLSAKFSLTLTVNSHRVLVPNEVVYKISKKEPIMLMLTMIMLLCHFQLV